MCFCIGSPALMSWARRLPTQNDQTCVIFVAAPQTGSGVLGISRFSTWSVWTIKRGPRTELLPEEKQVTFYPGRCV